MSFIDKTHESSWQVRAQLLLLSEQARDHIEAYTLLCAKCDESKHSQRSVGVFLRTRKTTGNEAGHINASSQEQHMIFTRVFNDLRASDRTVRIGAARLLCLVAYESMQGQEAIIACQQGTTTSKGATQSWFGATIGWLYIFSVPESIFHRYQARTGQGKGASDENLFVRRMVAANYASAYTTISQYYTSKCQMALPLSWSASENDIGSTAATNAFFAGDVSDPNEHILGFYLAPREKHFPEPDAAGANEFAQSLPAPEDRSELASVLHKSTLSQANSSSDQSNQLVATCEGIHLKSLTSRYGAEAIQRVHLIFDSVALEVKDDLENSTACVPHDLKTGQIEPFAWEPVLIGTIQRDPSIPAAIKLPLQRLQPSQQTPFEVCAMCSNFIRPDQAVARFKTSEHWRFIVTVLPQDIYPISWRHFLAKWRHVVDDFASQNTHSVGDRRLSSGGICSISSIRKSILATDASSYHSLDQLRNDLPGIFRSQRALNRAANAINNASRGDSVESLGSLTEIQYCQCPTDPDTPVDGDTNGGDSDCDEVLSPNLRQVRQMNAMSASGLDSTSRLRLRERSEINSERIHRIVRKQREIATRDKQRKSKAIDAKHGQAESNIKSLELQRGRSREIKAQRLDAKQQHAEWRRRQQQRVDQAWEQGVRDQIENQAAARLRRQQEQQRKSQPARPTTPRRPQSSANKQLPQRPKSARDQSRIPAPELARERAIMYAEAIRAVSTTLEGSVDLVPSLPVDRRFSTYRARSFRQKLTSDDAPQPRRRISLVRHSPAYQSVSIEKDANDRSRLSTEPSIDLPTQLAPENACSTLVMQQVAQQVAQRVSIPPVEPPRVAEPHVPPFVVLAQYQTLEEPEKLKFRKRFGLQRVRHQLSFELLRQFTRLARRDYAWRAFQERASSSSGAIKYPDFVDIAHNYLKIPQSSKQLLGLARKLDNHKTGWIEWKSFYTWWCLQFDPDAFDGLDEEDEAVEAEATPG